MKRFTAAILCVVMALSLCACSGLGGKKLDSGVESGLTIEGLDGGNASETAETENPSSEENAPAAEESAEESPVTEVASSGEQPAEATPAVTMAARTPVTTTAVTTAVRVTLLVRTKPMEDV